MAIKSPQNQVVYLIPGVVEQLLLLLHERGLLGEEAHADRLDVFQVLDVDVLHLRQDQLSLFVLFVLLLTVTLVCVDFDNVKRAGR